MARVRNKLRKQEDNKFFVNAAASSIKGEDNKSNDVLARLLHQHFLRHPLCGASALLSNATGIMRFELIGERKWPAGSSAKGKGWKGGG